RSGHLSVIGKGAEGRLQPVTAPERVVEHRGHQMSQIVSQYRMTGVVRESSEIRSSRDAVVAKQGHGQAQGPMRASPRYCFGFVLEHFAGQCGYFPSFRWGLRREQKPFGQFQAHQASTSLVRSSMGDERAKHRHEL